MAWNDAQPPLITRARMMALPPEAAYRELRSYGDYLVNEASGYAEDEELEAAMVGRGDPLVTLGVAQFGGSSRVLKALYDRARRGDGEHDRAVRIAILGNRRLPARVGLGGDRYGAICEEEAKRIVTSGGDDEIRALLLNPCGTPILPDLLNRKAAFAEVPEARLLAMIQVASTNPALNEEYIGQVGEGIRSLLQQTTASEQALDTLYGLFINLDPSRAGSFREDPTPIFMRWRALSVSEKFEKQNGHLRHTGLGFKDEVCCLMAALYGRWFARDEHSAPLGWHNVGTAGSSDIMLRCAYYGHAQMTPEEMEQAHERDDDAFTLAVLFNDGLFEDDTKRAKLESFLRLDHLRLYARRCRQIHARDPEFDPKPVTGDAAELLERWGVVQKESLERKDIRGLKVNLAALSSEVTRLRTAIKWGLIIFIAVLVILGIATAYIAARELAA